MNLESYSSAQLSACGVICLLISDCFVPFIWILGHYAFYWSLFLNKFGSSHIIVFIQNMCLRNILDGVSVEGRLWKCCFLFLFHWVSSDLPVEIWEKKKITKRVFFRILVNSLWQLRLSSIGQGFGVDYPSLLPIPLGIIEWKLKRMLAREMVTICSNGIDLFHLM